MAYRIAPSGATSTGPVYLYGYSFALNSAKTVKSLTLPNNRNVVVLAVDLTPADSGSTARREPDLESFARAATPRPSRSRSPIRTPGAVIYYTTNGTTPTTSSAKYTPGTPLQISSTTTIEAIAVASGYGNSAVSSGTYTITSQGTAPISVNLSRVDNVTGIVTNGSPVPSGGLDGDGDAYSATLLGTSLELERLDLHVRGGGIA